MTLHISSVFTYDEDAGNYIQAVETADGQALESATRQAINNFVIGCKQDGIWSAIKASCILAGARTLTGALVPLAGTAPTNNNFVSGDYNRKTGLVGNGSTKYLNSNRANNADPQNNQHLSVWVTTVTGINAAFIGSRNSSTSTGSSFLITTGSPGTSYVASRYSGTPLALITTPTNNSLYGLSRSSSSQFVYRVSGASVTEVTTSAASNTDSINVFNRGGLLDLYAAHRLAFYSIGESLDLAKLDGRVTDLITAFGAAIP